MTKGGKRKIPHNLLHFRGKNGIEKPDEFLGAFQKNL